MSIFIQQVKQSINDQAQAERDEFIARVGELQAEIARITAEHEESAAKLYAALVALGEATEVVLPPESTEDAVMSFAMDCDTFTVKDVAAKTGANVHTVRQTVRRLVATKKLAVAGKQSNGSTRPSVLYRLAPAAPKARTKFNERRDMILELLVRESELSGYQIAKTLNLSKAGVARDLAKLVEAGVLTYGKGSNGSRPVSLVA